MNQVKLGINSRTLQGINEGLAKVILNVDGNTYSGIPAITNITFEYHNYDNGARFTLCIVEGLTKSAGILDPLNIPVRAYGMTKLHTKEQFSKREARKQSLGRAIPRYIADQTSRIESHLREQNEFRTEFLKGEAARHAQLVGQEPERTPQHVMTNEPIPSLASHA